jgi:hypothetical protein
MRNVSFEELFKITLSNNFHYHCLALPLSKTFNTWIVVSVDCSLSDETACYVDEFPGIANTVSTVEVLSAGSTLFKLHLKLIAIFFHKHLPANNIFCRYHMLLLIHPSINLLIKDEVACDSLLRTLRSENYQII